MKTDLKVKTLYEVYATTEFKKSVKKIYKQHKDITKLEYVVTKLANKDQLEEKYKNHKLVNNKYYTNCWECHIEPDWLLVYKYHENELMLLLVNTGSHSEILDK